MADTTTIAEKIAQAETERQRINANIADAYTEAEAKGATMPATENSANLAQAVASIPTGPPTPVEEKDVNLWDYDGTLLFSYTNAEALALESLPVNSGVEHDLLVFQEWNWSLADIKEWVTENPDYPLAVGAIYTTTDGQNHNYWNNPLLTSASLISHVKRGTSMEQYAYTYNSLLNTVNIPYDTNISLSGLEGTGVKAIMIPSTNTNINQGAVRGANYLQIASIPKGITTIRLYAFRNCISLTHICLSNGITSIFDSAFQDCKSLIRIIIPQTVSTINADLFNGCISLKVLDLSKFTDQQNIPTLANVNALSGTPSDQIIYVANQEMLDAFAAATNWSTYADRFQIKGA